MQFYLGKNSSPWYMHSRSSNATIVLNIRVADDLPLYDILNEFQKGHSHMAVVVKCTKDSGVSTEIQKNATPDYKVNLKDAHADGMLLL
jgi:metal transporter CNNM